MTVDLDAHFPESIRQDVLDAVGLSLKPADAGGGDPAVRRRDPTSTRREGDAN